jgi:hypothetical protein
MAKFLVERYQYKEEDIVMLMDTPGASGMSLPTRANLVRPSFSFSFMTLLTPLLSTASRHAMARQGCPPE